MGVIVALGGQTPLKLSHSLDPALVLGTPVSAIDAAEDRQQWSAICASLGLAQPPGDVAVTLEEARSIVQAASVFRSWCDRVTSSVDAPWRSSTTTPR